MSNRKLAELYKINEGTVRNILKQKKEIINEFEMTNTKYRHHAKLREGQNDKINEAMEKFWYTCRQRDLPVTGPLQAQAREYAKEFEITTFKASNGWLDAFKKRLNITYPSIGVEGSYVNENVVSDWKNKLDEICEGFSAENIFNADETALFYRALPNKT